VRLRALAFTAFSILRLEHGRLGQASLPTLRQDVIGIARGRFSEYNFLMSLHRSLRSGGSTAAKRNVLKRFERVTLLKKRGQWKAGMKSTGLPKTKPE
jgi:small basic protein (TIGR04137 family)